DCTSLTSVTIGNSVTEIGHYAFCNCTSLTSVYCKPTTPPSIDLLPVFEGNASGRKIYVPAESVEAYKSAWGWNYYADAIVGYDF
ncbi:MAG: leucine-rich repeat protein, partial [Tidjanibacter sp.]|nr:leucine-rich repeat protein [Tidjanibacter sp.]